MRKKILLAGVDVGSTTCSFMRAQAVMQKNPINGRLEVSEVKTIYRGLPVFTPFKGTVIQEKLFAELLDKWIDLSGLRDEEIFSCGAIVTGLAAQASNVKKIKQIIREKIPESLIALAGDPLLESWVAFMGNCLKISRYNPEVPIINLDIGGGTVNAAIGLNGEVLSTGCCFVGSRHIQTVPGTYRLVHISPWAQLLFDRLGINKTIGWNLSEGEVKKIIKYYLAVLKNLVDQDGNFFERTNTLEMEQNRFNHDFHNPLIIFSGGVGELIYSGIESGRMPWVTHFGDLGIDLAREIIKDPVLSKDIYTYIPEHRGRATLFGLTVHSLQVSGSTVFLPDESLLPIEGIPLLGSLDIQSPSIHFDEVLRILRAGSEACCLFVKGFPESLEQIKSFVVFLLQKLADSHFPRDVWLVIVAESDCGKTLGNYISDWGQRDIRLIVLDEIDYKRAQYLKIGRRRNSMIPVCFYGMN